MTKILIIEDNKDNLDLMVYLFNQFGYLTITALDGEDGIAIAKQEMPDLIVCDIQLPKLDGYEVVKILKNDKALKHIPLVAVTAYAMVGDRDKIRAAGFDAYISKPINPAQFVHQIESLLPAKLRSNMQLKSQRVPAALEKQEEKVHLDKCSTALIVENYLANWELYKKLLESIGFEVVGVQTVKEGLNELQAKIPDIILSDFQLPDISGLDFLRLVRENEFRKAIPFIIMSATHPSENELQEIKMLNVNRFILLPIDPSEFLKIIRNICSAIEK